jgi:hypothetical protein
MLKKVADIVTTGVRRVKKNYLICNIIVIWTIAKSFGISTCNAARVNITPLHALLTSPSSTFDSTVLQEKSELSASFEYAK